MDDNLFFSKLITKDLTAVDSNRRLFEGVLTVEMKDRQGEITVRDELMKVLPIWIARGGPITDTHSNRVVGKGINYASTTVKDSEGKEFAAITIQGEIFKDYELDNEIWNSIKSGKYKGLSFGGATKTDRTPILEKDGSVAYALKDLEQYEVAVCEEPAVPLALITQHNRIAKAMAGNSTDRGDGTMCIRCDKFKCYVKKNGEAFADVTDKNKPQIDPKAEALEADRSQGPNQDNGATYHGTSKVADPNPEETDPKKIMQNAESAGRGNYDMYKGRSVVDSARYAEVEHADVDNLAGTPKLKDEKAMDKDEDLMLDRAGLEEEKKLEYANNEGEGPVRPTNKIVGALAAGADKVLSSAAETGGKIAQEVGTGAAEAIGSGVASYVNGVNSEETCKSDSDNPGGPKYDQTNDTGDKVDRYGNKMPKVMGKKPKTTEEKPQGRMTSRTGEGYKIGNTVETHTMSPAQLRRRESRIGLGQGAKKPYGNKTIVGGKQIQAKSLDVLAATFSVKAGVGLKTPTPSARNIKDENKPGVPGSKVGMNTRNKPAGAYGELTNPKKEHMQHGNVQDAQLSNHEATHLDPEIADKLKQGGCYNTCEVVREYNDKDKKETLCKMEPHFVDEKGDIWYAYKTSHQEDIYDIKDSKQKPGRNAESESEMAALRGNVPHSRVSDNDCPSGSALEQNLRGNFGGRSMGRNNTKPVGAQSITPETAGKLKTNSDNTYTGEPGGGNWGREPGVTREDESKSPQEAIQPKHVNATTNEEGAKGLDKAYGDPQLEANNSEDGVNRKIRLDNDPPAESFETKQKKVNNVAGWKQGESKQKPGVHASTDEHHAMVMGKVPPSRVQGSMSHSNITGTQDDCSELSTHKDVIGGYEAQENAEQHKSVPVDGGGNAGSGGVRAGAAYETSQQDTGAKDNPRKTEERPYTGGEDNATGGSNENFEKSIIIHQLNMEFKNKLI
jgi:hypothetical protein